MNTHSIQGIGARGTGHGAGERGQWQPLSVALGAQFDAVLSRASRGVRVRAPRGTLADVASAKHLATLADICAARRAILLAALGDGEATAETREEFAAIYRARFIAAYASSGVVPSDIPALYVRADVITRGPAAPGKRRGPVLSRERDPLAHVCATVDASGYPAWDVRRNVYPLRVLLPWHRAMRAASAECRAELHRAHRVTEHADAGHGTHTKRAGVIGLGRQRSGAKWWDGPAARRRVAHLRACLVVYWTDRASQRWADALAEDLSRAALMVRMMRSMDARALAGEVSSDTLCRSFRRLATRAAEGDRIMTERAGDAERCLDFWCTLRGKGARARQSAAVTADLAAAEEREPAAASLAGITEFPVTWREVCSAVPVAAFPAGRRALARAGA